MCTNKGDVVETLHFIGNRFMGLTNGLKATGEKATFGFGSAYTLDGVGNRTNTDLAEPLIPGFDPGSIGYTCNIGNILATGDSATYTHDANGNRIQKVAGSVTVDYTYDSQNRLTQVADGTQTTQYIYNGLGQRVGKVEDGVQTNYLVDPNGILPQVLAEMDENNDLIAFYVYDGAGLVAKVTPDNNYYFYHYDGLGSTVAITDSTAQIVNAYAYSPYGFVGSQETIENSFQYVGRFGVMAEGNGLYFMRARYYDPEVGRFINKDPIGYAWGDVNLYEYVGNNPVKWIDSLGLQTLSPKPAYNSGNFWHAPVHPMEYRQWFYVFATREGLVGGTTATGHVIKEEDIFVALPSRKALNKNVVIYYRGNWRVAPVWDVGPWNTKDPYWLTSCGRPQAESGTDLFGRKTNKAGIDLSNALFRELGLTDNDWVYWRFKHE
jgi:RHS repeat-associated protein